VLLIDGIPIAIIEAISSNILVFMKKYWVIKEQLSVLI